LSLRPFGRPLALGCGWTCGIEAITTVEVANGGGVWRWRMVEGEVEGEVAVEVQMRWRWRWSMAHMRWRDDVAPR